MRAVLLVLLLLAPGAAAQQAAPVAFFRAQPDRIVAGGLVLVDASDSQGDIVEYAWRWGEGDFVAGNKTDSRRFVDAGVVVIGLRVMDAAGAVAFANQSVLVDAGRPEAYLQPVVYEGRDGGRLVEVTAEFSTPSKGATRIVRYEWSFGEGEPFVEGNATERREFPEPGIYEISVRVTDDLGRQDVATYPVLVRSTFLTRMGEVWDDRASFVQGAQVTLLLAIGTTIVGFALAIVLALLRISRFRLLRWPALAYIEVIRGTPLFLQILITWLVLPYFGLKLSVLYAGALALVVNTVAYQAEAIRAGIQAIPTGQMEAAISLGLTYPQAMRRVIVPQAFRLALPALGNEFIILLKDTSLVSAIGVVELTFIGRAFANRTFLVVEPFLAVGLIYFVMTYALSYGLRYLERRLAIPGMGMGAHS